MDQKWTAKELTAVKPATAAPQWLSLSATAALLGVHQATLRRWSDHGRFPCQRTAGGHRRFSLGDVHRFLNGQTPSAANQTAAGWANAALATTRQQIGSHTDAHWLQAIADESLREKYREMGRQLLGLVLQYVVAEEPDPGFLAEAARIGRQQAYYGQRAGLSLQVVLEATLFFRDVIVGSSLEIPAAVAVQPETTLRLFHRVNYLLNVVELAIVDGFEQSREAATR
jgi:excisionase family DNA binding protein